MDREAFNALIDDLELSFPEVRCELNYRTPFELLVAVILSAQCTDKRVNAVTVELFKKYREPADFAGADTDDLERIIYTCGFYRHKSKSIKAAALKIIEEHGGKVPDDYDGLINIPGVGRKTANVILAEAFKKNAFAVDTHVLRVSNRLGIVESRDPYKVELAATALLNGERLGLAHILLVFLGRYICKARNPECLRCPAKQICAYNNALKQA